MRRNHKKKSDKKLYLIRYEDGTIASAYTTERQARKMADKEKELRGGGYIIL